jgi:hypothetical protein
VKKGANALWSERILGRKEHCDARIILADTYGSLTVVTFMAV